MGYQLDGRILEVCTCEVLCPCWVGEDPDGGTCDGVVAWRVDKGTIDGVDVSGLTLAGLFRIPGNILKGNWRAVFYVDESATRAQREALVDVWTGKRGGPLADFAQLIGEVVAVEQAPIAFEVSRGKGTLGIGGTIEADLAPLEGATGRPTTLHDTVFSTIPGSPAYVGKAARYSVTAPQYGVSVDLRNHNAIQGSFHFEG